MEKINSRGKGRPRLLSDGLIRAITFQHEAHPTWPAHKILEEIQSKMFAVYRNKHPDWTDAQIEAHIVLPGVNSVQGCIRKILKNDKPSCFDFPWHMGLMSNPKYQIPPDVLVYIQVLRYWAIEQKQPALTIRQVLWASRLYSLVIVPGEKPKNDTMKTLWAISGAYAWYEKICQKSGTTFDTTILDEALMEPDKKTRERRWEDALFSLSAPYGLSTGQLTPEEYAWLLRKGLLNHKKDGEA